MNDFQMSFLANERRDALVAEADRARHAKSTRQRQQGRQGQQTRSRRRQPGLGLFFGRVSLF